MKVKPTQISLFDFYESLAQQPEEVAVVAVKHETTLQETELPETVENAVTVAEPVEDMVVDIELPIIDEKTVQDEIIDFSIAIIAPVKPKAVKSFSNY